MAKEGSRIKILLRSVEGTGSIYAASKNRRTTPQKLGRRTYDARLRRHVIFREVKA